MATEVQRIVTSEGKHKYDDKDCETKDNSEEREEHRK